MTPLLVTAIASTASNLIDRWAESRSARVSAPNVSFQEMLEGANAAKSSPASRLASAMENLRQELLNSPEVRTAIDSSDPMRPAKLQLAPDGSITTESPGQMPRPLFFSQETAAVARSLAALLPAGAAL